MYLFLETGKGGRKKETHQCVVASLTLPTGRTPGPQPSPGWESNQQPYGSQAGAQSTEPHRPGCI